MPSIKAEPALLILLLAAAAVSLPGCVPVVLVAGTAYGAAVVHERRSPQTVLDDEAIQLRARQLLFEHPEIANHSRISITSYNHVVLLTGQAERAELSQRLAELVSELPKVQRVYNEVGIGPTLSLKQEANDAWITSRAKLALLGVKEPGFDATRVKVVTENGVVFLLGLVTPAEGDASAEAVRRLPGVVRVVKMFEDVPSAGGQPPPDHPADDEPRSDQADDAEPEEATRAGAVPDGPA